MLDTMMPEGAEEAWTSFEDPQEGFKEDLNEWWGRVGLPEVMRNMFVALSIWGDSAVMTKKDSVYTLIWSCLSGPCRRRYWICAFPKRVMCRCVLR